MTCKPEPGSTIKTLTAIAAALTLSLMPVRAAGDVAAYRDLVARARQDLGRGDGIAAEVRLKQAQAGGAPRAAIAALMGDALLRQGQQGKARGWLAAGEFTKDTAGEGFRALARLERGDGNLRAAGSALDRAIAATPKDAGLWVEVGELRYAGGEHVKALEAAEYALGLDPANVRALAFRGQFVRDQFGLAAALPWFERALEVSPDDMAVLGEYAATLGELGRAHDMLKVTRRMIGIDQRDGRAFYLQAVLAARAGKGDLARRLIARTKGRLDSQPGMLLLQGALELEAGNYRIATGRLENLLKLQPANLKAQTLLARALYLDGEFKQLVQRFAGVAGSAGATPYLLTVVARAHEALGQRDLAARLLDRAAAPDLPLVTAVAEGAELGGLIGAGQIGQARAMAERNRAAWPGSVVFQSLAGDVQLASGNAVGAIERYKFAGSAMLSESLLLRLIVAMEQAGQKAEAAALVEGYFSQNPSSRPAARLAASMAAAQQDWPRAVLILEYLGKSGSDRDPRLLAELAMAQLRSGDGTSAEASASRAYALQPASAIAAQAWGTVLAENPKRQAAALALLKTARAMGGDNPLLAASLARISAPAPDRQ